jgi:hypothetical protein
MVVLALHNESMWGMVQDPIVLATRMVDMLQLYSSQVLTVQE